jgi:hypothetical protein
MTRATCEDGGNDNNDYNDEELLRRRRRSLAGGDDRDEVEEGEGGDATAMPRRIACALSDLTSYLTSILSLVGRGTTVCTASTSTSTSSAAAALTHPDDRRRSYP